MQVNTSVKRSEEQVTNGTDDRAIDDAATPPSNAEPNVRINGNAALAVPTAATAKSNGTGLGNRPVRAQPTIRTPSTAWPILACVATGRTLTTP
ncbi:hypothetical protein GCM10010178_30080 [Lentzea flava]|uniref:Uncharacterized protein n=1 Tax=Lentzea flava TaxID=103732 RepID=A0ABQ2UHH9_9PSEU|nr:hypothetical protein GCM10010178_30080 [Lentzea flava]